MSLAARPNNIAPNICSVRAVVCALVGFAEEECWDVGLRVRINGVRGGGDIDAAEWRFFLRPKGGEQQRSKCDGRIAAAKKTQKGLRNMKF